MNKKNGSSNEIVIDKNGLIANDQSSDYNSDYCFNVAKNSRGDIKEINNYYFQEKHNLFIPSFQQKLYLQEKLLHIK